MSTVSATVGQQSDGSLLIALAGTIDEDADFTRVFPNYRGTVVLDLSGVRRLNSIGVHRWIKEFSRYTEQHVVQVKACSYPVVLQANCIANFFGKASVLSCLAPYFCPSCNANQMVEVTRPELGNGDGAPPEKTCVTCSSSMEFDELDHYFLCLKQNQK